MAAAQLADACRYASLVEAVDGVSERLGLFVGLVDPAELLLMEGNLCAARHADKAVVVIEPSEGLSELLAAMRAQKIDLGLTDTGHHPVPVAGLDAATVNRGGGAGNDPSADGTRGRAALFIAPIPG